MINAEQRQTAANLWAKVTPVDSQEATSTIAKMSLMKTSLRDPDADKE